MSIGKNQVNDDDILRLKNMLTVLDEQKHIWAKTSSDNHIEIFEKIKKKSYAYFKRLGFLGCKT